MQRSVSDNYLMRGGNGGLGEGHARNSEALMKRGEGRMLRHVSELRLYFMISVRFHTSQFLLIADMYRALFKFEAFNAMQSSCFDTVRTRPSFCRCM